MRKRFLGSLSTALLVLAGSALLLFNWSATGWKALAVPTSSMRPSIPQNSLVFVHKVPIKSLKVGDVITYTDPFKTSLTISHRIIEERTVGGNIPTFVTKGDANKVADVPISEGSVVGEVVGHVPHVGAWLLWAKKPIALLPLIYIPALLLMAEEVKRLSDYYKLLEPYKLRGFRYVQARTHHGRRAVAALGAVLILAAGAFWQPALALLKSNPVGLTSNQFSVAPTTPKCSATHTTNTTVVGVSNSSSQSSSSGNATGGTATSGNASNSNNTSTTITIHNGC